jgi:hypothetical protein
MRCDLYVGQLPCPRKSHYLNRARIAGRLADAPNIWLLNTKFKRVPVLYALKMGNQWNAAPSLAELADARLHGLRRAA